jgi:iron(III) transport system permease protein
VLLPFLALADALFSPPGEYWAYVRDFMLPGYFAETLLLVGGSAGAALILGIALAWQMSMYDFAGKRLFEALLILPLAVPPYIAAYAYDGLTGYTGLVQSFFRNQLDLRLTGLATGIPAAAWAIWIFSVTLFPYVYLLTRAFLKNQSASLFENALLLGGTRRRGFLRVGLPLLWPSATAGAILVCLEVLNDFGVASYYGLNTFTTAIFSAWFGMGDADTALKLAILLLALVLLGLLVRKAAHNLRRYHIVSSREKRLTPQQARGRRQVFIILLCAAACLAGFVLPALQMLYWLSLTWGHAFTLGLLRSVLYTLFVAGTATFLVMVAATGTAASNRISRDTFSALLSQGTTVGYAIPSAVLAVGVITLFTGLDKLLIRAFPFLPAMLLSMSSAMLIYAYAVRFFSIGYQAVESGFAKTGMIYAEVSRTLGHGLSSTFFRVELPLIRHALVSGAVLVFIDIIKELPLGLLLRPFNTETLGTTAYHFANNEVLEETALPSLCIMLAGAAFILLMRRWEKKEADRVS